MPLNRMKTDQGLGRLLGTLFSPLGRLYGLGARARVAAYRRGLLHSYRAGVPVISVGNLTTGGTGKTPMVRLLAQWLHESGCRPAILTRGYGGQEPGELLQDPDSADEAFDPGLYGDEACLLARSLPGVPVFVDPVRQRSAAAAVDARGAEVLLLDDGFQHLRLVRQLDILMVDASKPLWKDRVIPAGTMREPHSALERADLIVLTHPPDSGPPAKLHDLLARFASSAPVYTARHRPVAVHPVGGAVSPPDRERPPTVEAKSTSYLLVSGIGNPDAFRITAASYGLRIAGELVYGDHHHWSRNDLTRIAGTLHKVGGEAVLFTEKDAVRLQPYASRLPFPAYQLEIRIEVEAEEGFRQRVMEAGECRDRIIEQPGRD